MPHRIGTALQLAGFLGIAACAQDDPQSTWTAGDTVHVRVDRTIPSSEIRTVVVEKTIDGLQGDSVIFALPRKLLLASDGTFLLADGEMLSRVLIFSADGASSRLLGHQGSGPGEYESAAGGVAALQNGDWALFDTRRGRISVYDHAGVHKESWAYKTNSVNVGRMLEPAATGGVRVRLGISKDKSPTGAARVGYVASSAEKGLGDTVFVPTFGVTPTQFTVTQQVEGGTSTTNMYDRFSPIEETVWHPAGFPVLLETGEYRVAMQRADGKPLVVHRTSTPLKLLAEERKMYEDEILRAMRSVDATWSWPGGASPSTKATAAFVQAMRDGTIWVAVNLESKRYTYADSSGAQKVGFTSPVDYEVFSRDGELLGRVAVPSRFSLQDTDGKSLWAFERNEDDVVRLVKLRVEPPFR